MGKMGMKLKIVLGCIKFVVEKLWRRLCESLWENCEQVLHMAAKNKFSTENVVKVADLHRLVEKFCRGICT